MKKIYILAIAIAASYGAVTLSACNSVCKQGSGKMATENRGAKGFNKIDISGSYDVVIKQDSVESVSLTADDNLLQYITTNVDDHRLRVKSKGNMCTNGKFTLKISVRDITGISTSGAVNLASNGKLTLKDVNLDLAGASKITLDLNANTVNTRGTGVTDLNITGQASAHNMQISGAGTINALDFVVAKYSIKSSGASHCKINVLNQLDLESSGASEVEYRGNPANINNSKSGASTLKKID